MAEQVITYETLREIQRSERRNEQLFELADGFFGKVKEYLKQKDPKDEFQRIEIQNAKSILRDIVDRRERKILNQALSAARSSGTENVSNMTPKEKEAFKKIKTVLQAHRVDTDSDRPQTTEEKENADSEEETNRMELEAKEKEEELTKDEPKLAEKTKGIEETQTEQLKIKVLTELPEIVGSDFKNYGPFKEGEIVEIPKENASIFIEHGQAETAD